MLSFGVKFQASWYTFVAREQGLNVLLAASAGVHPLGIWTFTNRIFQFPSLAFNSLYVVGFPAMSNVLARGEDVGADHPAHGPPRGDRRDVHLRDVRGDQPQADPRGLRRRSGATPR